MMGAVRTRLESFKQPKQGKTLGGKIGLQKFGPKGGSGKQPDVKSLFWMARALQKDQASGEGTMLSNELQVLKRQGGIDRGAMLEELIDKRIIDVDQLLDSLTVE